ncbi:PQQ-dependent sugar dehydrogenase [Aestuariimicrobium soli]|uniref:PQQ-dependent sugar dehydrogenase n=1 Tax=Aestuariimicrobium soli TaxID=2035834 RepID=UPI003EBF93B6
MTRLRTLALAGLLASTAGLAACTNEPAPTEPVSTSAPRPGDISTPPPSTSIGPTPTTPTGSGTPTTSQPTSTTPSVVTQNLQAPWSIVFHGQTALISERDSGRILELASDGTTRAIGTIAGVVHEGEGGLLGLAVRDAQLYAYLTTASDNRIVRLPLTGEPGSLALGSPTAILTGIPKGFTHNGGRISFGPDGMLYATTGDAGDRPNAQDRGSLAGKILRLSPDGAVPAGNPFGTLVWSYGHRNPQGLAWAPDGTMYAAEFGQNTWDELNVIRPGGNYGWPTIEGKAGREGFIDPVQQWSPDDASPSGIAIAGDAIWIANLKGERLRRVPLSETGSSSEQLTDRGRLRDVAVAPDGALWVLTNNTDGRGTPRDGDDHVVSVPVA